MWILPTVAYFFLYIHSVFSQGQFTSFEPIPPAMIEWDQTNTTYYTGQTIQMNWTSRNFLSADLARIQYVGSGGTRTLTTGSGTPIPAGSYSVRLSDSSNGVASNVPLTIALASNTNINLQSTTRISVIQSKLMNIVPLDDTRILGSGQTTFCDNRNLTVRWRGLGEAQFGVASVTLRRQSGLSGTQTLATVSNVPVSGNTSVLLFCPRSVSPSTSNPYAFEISVQEPGGSAYTGTSPTFNFLTAPSPSPTASTTPSMTRTPSITPSSTPTPTSSPSTTSTTSASPTPTPSPTPTANPSIDFAAIARAAAESVDTETPAIAGALGGVGGILLLLGVYKWYSNKLMTERRKKRLQMTSKFAREAQSFYGIGPSIETNLDNPTQPSIVMYSVQGLPPRTSKKDFAPKTTSK
jgi:cell division septation protein DedD